MTKRTRETLQPLPDKIDLNLVVPSHGPRALRKGKVCFVDECGKENYGFGLCNGHYQRLKRTRPADFKQVKETSRAIIIMCSVEFCNNESREHGMCPKHYAAWAKENIPGYRERLKENARKRSELAEVKEQKRAYAKQRRKDKHVFFEDGFQETVVGEFVEIKTNLHTLAESTGYLKSMILGYLDNLVEDELIKSYTYDNQTLVVSMLVPRALQFYFHAGLNQKPNGVMDLSSGDDHWTRYGKDSAELKKKKIDEEKMDEKTAEIYDFSNNYITVKSGA